MTDTFSPSINPGPSGTGIEDTPRVRNAPFGDGYSQRTADGLNYRDRKVTLSWPVIEQDQYDELITFFDAHDGGQAFIYTLPAESVAMKWKYVSRRPGYVDADIRSLSVSIERVNDL